MKWILIILLLIPNICFSMIADVKATNMGSYYLGYTGIKFEYDEGVKDENFEYFWNYTEFPSLIYCYYQFKSDDIKNILVKLHMKSIEIYIDLYDNIHHENNLSGFYIVEDDEYGGTFSFPLKKIKENTYYSKIELDTRYVLKNYLSIPSRRYSGTLVAI